MVLSLSGQQCQSDTLRCQLNEYQERIWPNKQVGWEITNDMSKYRVGGKSKNDNRVDSFIWHLRVPIYRLNQGHWIKGIG